MLKADLHIHTNDDPKEYFIKHNSKQLIDYASKLGFNVISITGHNLITYNQKFAKYAKKKGIILIPGIELTLEKKHVLVYNAEPEDLEGINKIKDLHKLKKNKNILIIAAHPYFVDNRCLKKKLLEHIKLFDAIEYVHFYTKHINFNRKAELVAKRFNLPLIGNSDAHNLWQMNHTYTLIDAKPEIEFVIKAIKSGKVRLETKPLPLKTFLKVILWVVYAKGERGLKRFLPKAKKVQ